MKESLLRDTEDVAAGLVVGGVVALLISYIFFQNNILKGLVLKSHTNPPLILETKPFQKPVEIKKKETKPTLPMKIPIITYHYVEYVKDPGDTIRKSLNIIPSVFERELIDLNEAGYETYFVRDVPDIFDGTLQISTKSVILTFDDGYEDFYVYVFPLLKKYHVKATTYIVYDFVGRRGFMNRDQLNELIASGLVEIGAHTLDHVYLKSLPASIAKKQIVDSKKNLEEDYDIEIKTFAYPYGAFDQNAIDLVKEASFSAAVSTVPESLQSNEELFYLGRYRAGTFSGNIVGVLERLKK